MKSNSMQTENFGRDFQFQIYLKNLLFVEAHEKEGMTVISESTLHIMH